jgi:cytochrome c oxidase assembly factor CtaG
MSLAFAHSTADHVHQVGGISLLTDWSADPIFLIPLVGALLYFRGLRRYRSLGGRRFSRWRQGSLLLGLAVTALALLSPIDRLADWSFTWHMLQHELLMALAVPALLLGQPFLPVVWGLPRLVRRRLFIPLARTPLVRWVLRVATRPVVGLAAYTVAVWAWHSPGLYDAALASDAVHYLEHLSFVLGAALFWWNVITPYPFPARLNVFLRVLLVMVSEIPNVALSAMITFSDTVLYSYGRLEGFWGVGMLEEQQLGGVLMWVAVGATVRLCAAMAILIAYGRAEEAKEPPKRLYLTGGPAPGGAS